MQDLIRHPSGGWARFSISDYHGPISLQSKTATQGMDGCRIKSGMTSEFVDGDAAHHACEIYEIVRCLWIWPSVNFRPIMVVLVSSVRF
jgi:hypothetical protein